MSGRRGPHTHRGGRPSRLRRRARLHGRRGSVGPVDPLVVPGLDPVLPPEEQPPVDPSTPPEIHPDIDPGHVFPPIGPDVVVRPPPAVTEVKQSKWVMGLIFVTAVVALLLKKR